MTVRSALIGSLVASVMVAGLILGALSLLAIEDRVERAAQERVDYALAVARTQYDATVEMSARRLQALAREWNARESLPDAQILGMATLDEFAVLNLCAPDGRPIVGDFDDLSRQVPVRRDDVLRSALLGRPASGTVKLEMSRIEQEGGAALRERLSIPVIDGREDEGVAPVLFMWASAPVLDGEGAVRAILYGGRPLNRDFEFVDRLQQLVFGGEQHDRKPVGTVTVFADDIRIATNVVDTTGQRGIGTRVSEPVRQHVLEESRTWNGRALVLSTMYFSAYEPLRDPDGLIIGMLYVGMLEQPYVEMKRNLMIRLGIVLLLVLAFASLLGSLVVSRITRPLTGLRGATRRFAEGELDEAVAPVGGLHEIRSLGQSFEEMRQAIVERDERLHVKRVQLEETNEHLQEVNSKYMQTLGFVTHELKSPLGAMQTMIDTIARGYTGVIPEKTSDFLHRIARNCEELQDMVKNYLDLSRLERGEMTASKRDIDCLDDVIQPSVDQVLPLFEARGISLEVSCPAGIGLHADPELLRIAVSNYLSNASKYGREQGAARLEVTSEGDGVSFAVWNEGPGFESAEREALFQQFSRLQNDATKGKKGSGVGLFLCSHIASLHGGTVDASSEPGRWARFVLRLRRDG